MHVVKLTDSRIKRPLAVGRTKKAAESAFVNEVESLTGDKPESKAYKVEVSTDLALLFRLNAKERKALKDGEGIVIRPAG